MSSTPIIKPRDDMGSGFPTLLRKELSRFWKVAFQTIAAPVLTALLYLLIFARVQEAARRLAEKEQARALLRERTAWELERQRYEPARAAASRQAEQREATRRRSPTTAPAHRTHG